MKIREVIDKIPKSSGDVVTEDMVIRQNKVMVDRVLSPNAKEFNLSWEGDPQTLYQRSFLFQIYIRQNPRAIFGLVCSSLYKIEGLTPFRPALYIGHWTWSGEYKNKVTVWKADWFKENEDMGDITKEHRTMKVMEDSLERTIKSQKRKLVEHDNLIENLQRELNSLKVKLLKGGNRSCLFES